MLKQLDLTILFSVQMQCRQVAREDIHVADFPGTAVNLLDLLNQAALGLSGVERQGFEGCLHFAGIRAESMDLLWWGLLGRPPGKLLQFADGFQNTAFVYGHVSLPLVGCLWRRLCFIQSRNWLIKVQNEFAAWHRRTACQSIVLAAELHAGSARKPKGKEIR